MGGTPRSPGPSDWREDAARRDFTMNAMSLSADGIAARLLWRCGGLAARAGSASSGHAAVRVAEDYLRILRFFRFQARYGSRAEPDPAKRSLPSRAGLRRRRSPFCRAGVERAEADPASPRSKPQAVRLDGGKPECSRRAHSRRLQTHGRSCPTLPPDPVLRMAALLTGEAAAAFAGPAEALRSGGCPAQRARAGRAAMQGDDAELRRQLAEHSASRCADRPFAARPVQPEPHAGPHPRHSRSPVFPPGRPGCACVGASRSGPAVGRIAAAGPGLVAGRRLCRGCHGGVPGGTG